MPFFDSLKPVVKEYISVEELLDSRHVQLSLRSLTGTAGLRNKIVDTSIHRPQLALAGYTELFTYNRVQVFGNTEVFYLKSLSREERLEAFSRIAGFAIPCIIFTNNYQPEKELVAIALERGIPLLQCPLETTRALKLLFEFLDLHFAPQMMLHGSFVDVYGVGILFVGRSGIGKSEIVLDLVERGHRLVADDAVLCTRRREDIIIGEASGPAKHFMEIRGLGIINVRQMFGMRAIRFQKRLEIIVELEEWDPAAEYTRTGLDVTPGKLMDVDLFSVKLPIFPGKNITVIAEVIALNYLLRIFGYDAAKDFATRIQDEIQRKQNRKGAGKDTNDGTIPYFANDFE